MLKRIKRLGRRLLPLLLVTMSAKADTPARWPSRWVETPTHRVKVWEWGPSDADTLLFLVHGTPGNGRDWKRLMRSPELAPYRFAAPDRAGFGQTEGRNLTSVQEHARLLLQVAREVAGGRTLVLVGHSYGGPVVVQMAALDPAGVHAAVSIAGALDPDLEKVTWFHRMGTKRWVRWLLPQALDHSNQELIPLGPQLRELAPHLPGLRPRMMAIQGGKDFLVNPRNAEFLAKHLPKGSLVDYQPAMDHFIIFTKVPWLAQWLRKNL